MKVALLKENGNVRTLQESKEIKPVIAISTTIQDFDCV